MVETTRLADGYDVPRVIVGGWQLSPGHSSSIQNRDRLFEALASYADAGLSTFDCADIYGGVEELLGSFRSWYAQRKGEEAASRIHIHTKFVPDRDDLPRMSRAYVERIIDRSLRRLGTDRIDLVQFHWWDLEVPRYAETAGWLSELQQSGKIRLLGVTNFDTAALGCLVESGFRPVSHQVQYSVLDRRPQAAMTELCRRHGIQLLCYGTVAGGFLSARYIGEEPTGAPANRSLVKYRLIIDELGGWEAFQDILGTLDAVARRHQASIANVATRWVLGQPQVAAAIVGARDATHLQENLGVFSLSLGPQDQREIDKKLEQYPGPTGDVYQLERDRRGRHAAIMRYNLNREA